MRTGPAAAVVSLVAFGLLARASSSAPSPPDARTWRAVLARTDATEKRLDGLVARARTVDPHFEAVYAYEAYGKDEMLDPKRVVVVEKTEKFQVALLDLLTNEDESTPPEAREAAANAIIGEQSVPRDPALALGGRKRDRPRVKVSEKVVRLLSNNDVVTRTLAQKVLLGLWQGLNDADIKAYDARNKGTWGRAREAWLKYLAK